MKNVIYLTIIFVGIVLSSCKKRANGDWDDNIKLSQKNISFNSSQNSVTVTTQSTYYWLGGISFDGKNVDLKDIDRLSKNFVVTQANFQVERREDGKKIIITMNQNDSNAERTLWIHLQSGDYFDGIKVIQKK